MITLDDKKVFHDVMEEFSKEPQTCEVTIKVFYYYMKNTMPDKFEQIKDKIHIGVDPLPEFVRKEYIEILTQLILEIASEECEEV